MHNTKKGNRVFLVGVGHGSMTRSQMERSFAELESLVYTAGGKIVSSTKQMVKHLDPATFIGKGKIEEIKREILKVHADLVVIDEDISPMQNRNLEDKLGVFLLDRTAVILDIFAMRARTREGKLQVELAQLDYLAPRLVGHGKMFSQQTGGIGTRGPGETQLEYDRRRIRERINVLKRAIEKVRLARDIHRSKREAVPIPLVAVVGYTNAGKSTLVNYLTDAGVFVEDKLFATLDPTVRKFRLPSGREILLADTVGFIRRLPHQLVAAFKATFEEISHADLLLIILDGSDPDVEVHIRVVNQVLEEMKLNHKPSIVVYNKCDKSDFNLGSIQISALKGEGIDKLIQKMDILLRSEFHHVKLYIPYNEGAVLSMIYRIGHVYKTTHYGKNVLVECELPDKYASKYKSYQRSLRT